jgi:hypothetical protein
MYGRVEQGAKDAGARHFEPRHSSASGRRCARTGCKHQKNAAVGQIRSADDILDAIHQQRARGLKEDLVIVG